MASIQPHFGQVHQHKSCMDSQFSEFQKCFTTRITSLNSYISVKCQKGCSQESKHIVCFHDLVIQGVTAEHLMHRAEAPNDVGDDALKAADGVYWKKL